MAKLNTSAKITDPEFSCLLAISSEAFEILSFLSRFINVTDMNQEQYAQLLSRCGELRDNVFYLRDMVANPLPKTKHPSCCVAKPGFLLPGQRLKREIH